MIFMVLRAYADITQRLVVVKAPIIEIVFGMLRAFHAFYDFSKGLVISMVVDALIYRILLHHMIFKLLILFMGCLVTIITH